MLDQESGALLEYIVMDGHVLVRKIIDRFAAPDAAQSSGLVVAAGDDAEQAAHGLTPTHKRRAGTACAVPAQCRYSAATA
jgi:hypothetical protein